MKIVISMLFLMMSCFGADAVFATSKQLNTTDVNLSSNGHAQSINTKWVSRIAVRVIPGYCGKVYISLGSSTPDVTNLSNVAKILYPNCNGGLSDEWTITDLKHDDSIDTSLIHVAGQIPGEYVAVEYYQTGATHASVLTPVTYGKLTNWSNDYSNIVPNAQAIRQFNAIPGMSGKFWINNNKVVYPNNGTVTGTITDKYEIYGRGGNDLPSMTYNIARQVTGETILVSFWSYN